VTSPWGRRRATDDHRKPYQLTRLQIGNEERLDENYWQRFKPIAEAIWAKDANIILVVGDFAYGQPISDPFNFKGAAAPITSLAAQQKILHLAKAHNREVWFDVHVNTDGPLPDFGGTFSYIDALKRIADGAKHRVVIFEFNAGNHSQKRALANAAAINWIERDGRLPIATSANCLQPDRQNDNDWDQGLLFLNPEKVWLQLPGYVTRMISRNYQPLLVKSAVSPVAAGLDVTAKRDESGKTLVVQVVNAGEKPQSAKLNLTGFVPRKGRTRIETLSGPLESRNTAENPHQIKPQVTERESNHGNTLIVDLPPHSFTVIRLD